MGQNQRLLVAIMVGIASMVMLSMCRSSPNGEALLPTAPLISPEVAPTLTAAPRATETAVPTATVLFSDAFDTEDALDNWTIVELAQVIPGEESRWIVEDGQLAQDRTAMAGNPNVRGTMVVTGADDWTDYTLTARVYDDLNGTFGLVARRQGNSFYRYRLIVNEFEDTPKQVLEKVIDGEATPLVEIETPGYDQDTWHTASLSVMGQTITAALDGEIVAEATDTTLERGQAGLYTVAVGGIFFDDVTVTTP